MARRSQSLELNITGGRCDEDGAVVKVEGIIVGGEEAFLHCSILKKMFFIIDFMDASFFYRGNSIDILA